MTDDAIQKLPLRLEYVDPATLTENAANWRSHPEQQVVALGAVLNEVGWAGACLYNERTKHLIDGHARRKVAIEKGEKVVPVLIGSWSEEEEKRILATLDPLAALAGTNAKALDDLLAEVKDLPAPVESWLSVQADSARLSELMGELKAEGDGGSGPRALTNDPHAVVKVVLPCSDVGLFERALAATGEMNRANALKLLCEGYLARGEAAPARQ